MNRETRMLVYGLMLMFLALVIEVAPLSAFSLPDQSSAFVFFAGLAVSTVGTFKKTKA